MKNKAIEELKGLMSEVPLLDIHSKIAVYKEGQRELESVRAKIAMTKKLINKIEEMEATHSSAEEAPPVPCPAERAEGSGTLKSDENI